MNKPLSLYLHVPFCRSICYYCDFCHRAYESRMADRWLEELEREILSKDVSKKLKTIYIGGGTPSCLDHKQFDRLLDLLEPYASEVIEYTVEVNPESVDQDKVALMRKHGVNRVSMGVQSFDDELLKTIGRRHDSVAVLNAISLLREGDIENISCDLMYSLPGQTVDSFLSDVERLADLGIPHISFYSLTVEENSVFGKRGVTPLDGDTEAEMYERASDFLIKRGYRHYEISNFAKDDLLSKHNMAYWHYDDFYGISAGASGKEEGKRYDNVRSLNEYLDHHYVKEIIPLSLEDQCFEMLMMSTRTDEGLDLKLFKERFGLSADEAFGEPLKRHLDKGTMYLEGEHLIVRNRALLNSILIDFL